MITLLGSLYVASTAGLALFGFYGFLTFWLFLRHRRSPRVLPALPADLPAVTVQLPIYNERDVVERLIAAAAALDYPRDRLEIQVLDDSTDDTTALAAACVAAYRARGVAIELIHRDNRQGYKAGALAAGLQRARGEYIAVFDADFLPAPDFLRQTIPYFVADPRLGLVQARWGHLNPADTALTAAQAVALDKHFAIEQAVRHRAGLFPKFNGSAGVWRRACVVEVGGWKDDTVCEDLCLSTRAVLAGWQFHFVSDVVAPAELPDTILAYKQQQARWAMGSTQCLVRYAAPILGARNQTLGARLYALISMSAYATQGLLLLLLLLQLPLVLAGYHAPAWVLAFSLLGLGQPLLFVLAQRVLYPDWPSRLRTFPALLLIAVGTAPNGAWAVARGLTARQFTFLRTPKGGRRSYRLSADGMLAVETGLAVYATVTLVLALLTGNLGAVMLLTLAALGCGYVAWLGITETRLRPI